MKVANYAKREGVLITNSEIVKLKDLVEGTEAEELCTKLHKSYNTMVIAYKELKEENKKLKEK